MQKRIIVLILSLTILPLTYLAQGIDANLIERLQEEKKTASYQQQLLQDSLRKGIAAAKPSVEKPETLSIIEKMFNERYLITPERMELESIKDSLTEEMKSESLKIELRTQYLKSSSLDKYLITADTTYFQIRKKLLKTKNRLDSLSITLRQFGYDIFKRSLSNISTLTPVSDNYILGPGDEVYIDITGELNESFIKNVDRGGSIVLPYIGSIKLWGKTYEESKKLIEQEFQKEFSNIEVSVSLGHLKSVNVFILGEVNKPGVYNITMLSNPLAPLFEAGGLKKTGSLRKIKYISSNGRTKIIDLYKLLINEKPLPSIHFSSGDIIFVPPIGEVVGITGAVNRPGIYELKNTESLAELFKMAGEFLPTAGKKRIQLERVSSKGEKITEDLKLKDTNDLKKTAKSKKVKNGDLITVFEISPYLQNYVKVKGNIKNKGIYEFKKGMTVLDLIKEAGGQREGRFSEKAELFRLTKTGKREIIKINLKNIIENPPAKDIKLKKYDELKILIKEEKEEYVHLKGEFIYPGTYPIKEETKLKEVIDRAGGFTENAFIEGAIFTKKSVERAQNRASKGLTRETRLRLLAEQRSVMGSNETEQGKTVQMEYLQAQQEQLTELKKIQTPGRVAINLLDSAQLNIPLEDGDRIYVPRTTKTVQIIGEVYNPMGIVYEKGLSLNDCLEITGGPKPTADKKEIYVRRASGRVKKGDFEVKPGDTIIVPEKVQIQKSFWSILANTADVLYKVAVAVMAIESVTD